MRASSLPMRGDGGRRWLPRLGMREVSGPIPEASRSQRHSLASTHQSRNSQHERTHRTLQSRWRKTGWGDANGWERGKYLAWDAAIVHTSAASYITHRSGEGESAAVQEANRKTLKYEGLPVSRNNLSPHVMWSPFRYTCSVFRLIRPDQSERVERSPSCKRIPRERYEIIPLEKVSQLNLIVLVSRTIDNRRGKQLTLAHD